MELNGMPATVDQVAALALRNYGHFTSMRVEGQQVRGLSLHLERLVRDCRSVFDAQLDPDQIRYLVRHALADDVRPIVVRVTVFDPDLGLERPGAEPRPQVLVTSRPAMQQPLPPLHVQATKHCRDMPAVKHVGLFGLLRQRRRAQLNGYDDAVFTDSESNISEGATWNIGFFDGDRIVWPQAEILRGVTMSLIDQVHGGPTTTAPINLARLPEMRAAFAANAAIGVRAIVGVNDNLWPQEHPVLDVLRQEYAEIDPEPL